MTRRCRFAGLLLTLAAPALAAVPQPPEMSLRKFNPGHYVAVLPVADSTASMAALKVRGVRGFIKRYPWRELEPIPGVYDFREVETDLAWAKANGVELIVFVVDKSFDGSVPTPEYLAAWTAPTKNGFIAVRWHPYVVERLRSLLSALARFDAHPAFEGVALQETAPSMTDAERAAWAYTPEKYRDMYLSVLTHAARALPASRVFWHQNFLPGRQEYLDQIAAAVAPLGVVMGGPDILPDSLVLQERVYPLYIKMAGKMPLFCSAQFDSYAHVHAVPSATKYWTPAELYAWGKTVLRLDYVMWTAKKVADPADSYTWHDAVPVIGSGT